MARSLASLVGASLLAMVVNDDAGCLVPRGGLRLIASRLAPTEVGGENYFCAVWLSQLGILNTQNDPP